jgi:hypothetical protein
MNNSKAQVRHNEIKTIKIINVILKVVHTSVLLSVNILLCVTCL